MRQPLSRQIKDKNNRLFTSEVLEMSKIKFEEGYIFKNNRNITSSPDIALTELVANAWDAGALNVEIN